MEEQILRQALETAGETIRTLRGAVEALGFEQKRLEKELEALKEERVLRQEEKEARAEGNPVLSLPEEEHKPGKQCGKWARELSDKLSFYYKDFSAMDGKWVTAEDGERMYHILGYVFDTLKKTGVEFKK
ncbi:MAG: hypothetical protein SPI25_06050 [Dialister sp.]|nr:hypothetical protein [Dialister sp.]